MTKNAVIIKSFSNGITLHLDAELEFSQLLEEVAFKFKESSVFFKEAKMALSIEGRSLSEEEERSLIATITENSEIHIICIVGKDENTNQNFIKALQQFDYDSQDNSSEGQFYKGTLKNGQVLETETSIVILGDVYPGSAIISQKNIIIIGGLYGEAYAGGNGNKKHYVVALEMSPERLTIGDFKYKSKEKVSKWSIKPKIQPKIAFVSHGKVIIEPLTKELLSEFPI